MSALAPSISNTRAKEVLCGFLANKRNPTVSICVSFRRPRAGAIDSCRRATVLEQLVKAHLTYLGNNPVETGRTGTRSSAHRTTRWQTSTMTKATAAQNAAAPEASVPSTSNATVMINGATGKMGFAVAKAVVEAGLTLAPLALAGPGVPQQEVNYQGVKVQVYGGEDREEVMTRVLEEHPDVIVVDFTLPVAVNDNAEFYCRRGVPFVMGTTGGDRSKLLDDVRAAGLYAVIAPQMGKQIVAFLASMEALADSCPGAFTGYTLKVVESHQSSKVDTSGTAKEVVKCFQRLGLDFSFDQIELVREPEEQMSRMGVPEEYLKGHAYHTYSLLSPDGTVSFQFQHNVCGQSIYAQGVVDAVLFLSKKIAAKSDKKLFNMIDVLREGAMR
eukprot:jgi/Mesen1/10519/ME000083S10015